METIGLLLDLVHEYPISVLDWIPTAPLGPNSMELASMEPQSILYRWIPCRPADPIKGARSWWKFGMI